MWCLIGDDKEQEKPANNMVLPLLIVFDELIVDLLWYKVVIGKDY